MGKYFGTDGFRGKVNFNLTAKQAYKIGEALGTIYKAQVNKPKFVIGRDTRLSGTMLLDALSSGINSCGGDVYVLDLTTTPSISYLVIENKFNAGIMISASHNPYYDNGIKLISSNGEKMDEKTILTIEEINRFLESYSCILTKNFVSLQLEIPGMNLPTLGIES